MSAITRRAALTAAAIPLVATTATAWGAPAAAIDRLDSLWASRTKLAAESRAIGEAYEAAEAKLPEWAASGPCMLLGDGTWCGPHVWWPRIEDGKLPIKETYRLNKRPGPRDIREQFEHSVLICGPTSRARIREIYREKMRDLIARIRLQREERSKLGLDEIGQRGDAASAAVRACENEIEAADPSPQKVLALLLMGACYHSLRADTMEEPGTALQMAAGAIEALRPLVGGILREHVDYLFDHPDMPIAQMPFWA
jgi:hypothetical protein